ncbi:DUF3142 domain-containing protein [Pokkaliibacter sp. MBI-7]|uniref:DUF3142 domain-containing protein n=1 Tax=Pokkaliibacter sp. MBI-7 TaxID=3040600 RepID=UPI002449CEC8|nr:DUF3142 domain-containing protein [Pokkaliibacter sp. MBI-7]MDH2432024.1 DUF3142 domain-containing protein [Pokkaliibacter sp. MBI-7]
MSGKSFWRAAAMCWLLICNVVWAEVQAPQYRQFWLWAGVKPQPVLQQAEQLYVLQGQINGNASGQVSFSRQGPAVVRAVGQARVWLAYRVRTLQWDDSIVLSIRNQLQYWQQAGRTPVGIQLDFDAGSYQLGRYADFLRQLREQLPAQYRLSITGLLDWTRTGDVATLNSLTGTVDELVVQTYQGRHSVAGYERYLASLSQLRIPFKVGLVQGGEWDVDWQRQLQQSPYYRGEVVFLLNP